MTSSEAEGVSMKLEGVQETTFLPLAAKAQDSESSKPILGDRYAAQTLSRIDSSYDWRRARGDATFQNVLVSRARLHDNWTAEFIKSHDLATILHIACGLDSRCMRLAPLWTTEKNIRWIDVDLPDVIELRKSLELPQPEGDYELKAADALAQEWLDAVPADRPTLIIAEGLVMYLQPEDALSLFKRVARRFEGVGGQIICDLAGSWVISSQKRSPTSRMAMMHWAVDNPSVVVDAVKANGTQNFHVDDLVRTEEMGAIFGYNSQLTVFARVVLWLISWSPWRMFQNTKFVF
jgi:O-methyltransferase involved in polyketide biosynthesis